MSYVANVRITPKFKEEGLEGYGTIQYVDLPQGNIKIVNDFFKKYMVKIDDVPWVGKKWMHKAMVQPLMDALRYIEHKCGYDDVYEYIEDLSIYCPRHIWRKASKPLSMHAYGLAFDVNAWENMPGDTWTIPDEIVDVFKNFGFKWGGDFKKPDAMHFELKLKTG